MDRRDNITGAVGIILTALLLTYGNVLTEFVLKVFGI